MVCYNPWGQRVGHDWATELNSNTQETINDGCFRKKKSSLGQGWKDDTFSILFVFLTSAYTFLKNLNHLFRCGIS